MDDFVADRIYVDAAPERVFETLVSAEDMLIWLDARRARIDARPGGLFSADRQDGSIVSGVVERLEPPERLELAAYHHASSEGRRGPMRVIFTVAQHGEGAWFTVRQEGLACQPNWKPFAEATRQKWVLATVALKRHIEQI